MKLQKTLIILGVIELIVVTIALIIDWNFRILFIGGVGIVTILLGYVPAHGFSKRER